MPFFRSLFLPIAILLFVSSSEAGFEYKPAILKHKSFAATAVIEGLILENCLPAKTLDFMGSLFEVEPQHNDKGVAYTVHYDLKFPERTIASALVVQSYWPDNHGGIGKPFNVLTDKYSLCR